MTGAGTATMAHPHHRFWSNQAGFPSTAPGALSGGPNRKGIVGVAKPFPVVGEKLTDCIPRPASCWIDDIGAYSVNEITINWNAALAWVLGWENDYAGSKTGKKI